MCTVHSGLRLRLWFRERRDPTVHRHHCRLVVTSEAPVQVCSQPVLHLDQEARPSNPSESPEGNTV